MLTEKVEKLDLTKFDFLFESLDPLPKDYYNNINRYHGETNYEFPDKREFWNDSLIGLSSDCEECNKMRLTREEKQFFLESLRRNALNEEQRIGEWNKNIAQIPTREYEEKEHNFLVMVWQRSPIIKDAMETNQAPEPYSVLIGKRCSACRAPNIWRISVGSDIKVLTRREIKEPKEICPRCALEGSKYVDNRGYVYFQHYIEGERKVCYIGKIARANKP